MKKAFEKLLYILQLFMPHLKKKEGKVCKVNSILWIPTHFTETVLVPRGLIFETPLLYSM